MSKRKHCWRQLQQHVSFRAQAKPDTRQPSVVWQLGYRGIPIRYGKCPEPAIKLDGCSQLRTLLCRVENPAEENSRCITPLSPIHLAADLKERMKISVVIPDQRWRIAIFGPQIFAAAWFYLLSPKFCSQNGRRCSTGLERTGVI